ncbi:MAG: hypothetical protein HWN51_03535 [Desulfobacterales bacterium]|nr:hypothetical protein [Desulfobacterales bacterium]
MRNIANTTVISNFAAVGQLDLLQRIVKELHIPLKVYKESKRSAGVPNRGIFRRDWGIRGFFYWFLSPNPLIPAQ